MKLSDLPPGYGELRVPQHSLEGESSVLSGLLLDNEAWDRVGDLLTDQDFYRSEHKLIYGAIGVLVTSNKQADVITVYEYLQKNGQSEDAGGLSYLNTLAQYIPSANNIRRYAEIVHERSILRRLAKAGNDIATASFAADGKPVREVLDAAEQQVMAIGESNGRTEEGFKDLDSVVVSVIDRISALAEDPSLGLGLTSGFTDLDRMTSGFAPGDLVIIGGRPGSGKTSLG